MLKKVLMCTTSLLLVLGCVCSLELPSTFMVNAYESEDVIEYEHIPVKMQPYSIIEFIDDTHYVILQGGVVEDEQEYSRAGMPKPKAGLVVTYADDGFVLHAIFPDNIENPYEDLEPDDYGVEPYAYIFDGEEYDRVAVWGSNKNTLYQKTSGDIKMIGVGRATTFSPLETPPSIYGCYGNKLEKGDIALKMDYDNCANGDSVTVIAQKKSGGTYSKTMNKGDRGGMPDAVVDIWYTGVEFWGYTYSLSLSIPGTTTIKYVGSYRL